MKENVTVWNTSTPRIQLKYSGGPENVTLSTLRDSPENGTVPGYGETPDEGGKGLDSRVRGNDKRRGVHVPEELDSRPRYRHSARTPLVSDRDNRGADVLSWE